jgi:hypothetical protein
MNTQKLFSVLFGTFLLLASLSLVSAITVTFTQTTNFESVTTGVSAITSAVPTNLAGITLSTAFAGNIVNITANVDYANLKLGKVYSTSVVVSNGTNNETIPVKIIKTFASNGSHNVSDLSLEVDIVNRGDGDSDTSWLLLDDIEVELKFSNDKSIDLKKVYFELGLFDSNGNQVSDDLLWTSEDEDKYKAGTINDGDDESYTFEFKVPSTLEDGDYILMVKAYSDDKQFALDYSSDLDNKYYNSIKIERESDDERQIVLDDVSLDQSGDIPCGTNVVLQTKAYNIGTVDQDAVKIIVYNKELGIDQDIIVTNFDTDDDAKNLEFLFTIPTSATEKKYTLDLYSLYGYDEDEDEDGEYPDSAFEDTSEKQKLTFIVKGNCYGSTKANITSVELSDSTPRAIIGNQVILEATLKNLGSSATTFTIDTLGNTQWSTLATVDPKTITLNAGESKKVSLYLEIKNSAEVGEKEFSIVASSGAFSTEQKVKLNLEKGITGSAILDHIKNNWVIYTIILVNLILIIAIILVVKSILSSKH